MFSPNTEFGGIVREISTDTRANTVIVNGYTWRGMLAKKIITPAPGQDYAKASGEINSIIKSMVEAEFPGMFCGVDKDTGVRVENYQFDRYCTLHAGMTKMLKSVGYRLDIRYRNGAVNEVGYVMVQAVPIVDYSKEYELSNDNNMNFTMDDNRRGVNHLICLGKGDLKDRLVVHLYVDGNNNVGYTQHYRGADEIAEIYDSNGSEKDDLIKNGIEKARKDLRTVRNIT
ncbi:MAG: Gp37-like protein [[Clostridium] scindens]